MTHRRPAGHLPNPIFERDMIAENRDYWNMAEVFAQIGFTPA
jgi:hypothetical protein